MEQITNPKCIFKYLKTSIINHNLPGFADCLRGMIACYIYSKKYNYEFYICKNIHPIFQFFKNTPYFLEDFNDDVIELFAPLSYEQIDLLLEDLFKSNEDFSLLTNSFYKNREGKLEWFAELESDTKRFFKSIFIPNNEINKKMDFIMQSEYLFNKNTRFSVIHIRTMALEMTLKEDIKEHFYQKINDFINTDNLKDDNFVLMTDYHELGIELNKLIPRLNYWSNEKGHTGVFTENIDGIRDSVIDFFIMSKSSKIYSIVDDYGCRSGFSKVVSLIYDIDFVQI